MSVSAWAVERLGAAADRLQDAVVGAFPRAHDYAVAAQAVSGTSKQDPYGHTMKNRQYECLVEDAREIPGIKIVRPAGASYELVTVVETQVVLYPWRFATDNARSREHVRMRTSDFRRELLAGLSRQPGGQLGLDQAELEEAQLDEDEAVAEQLRSLVRVVTIGYRSNVSGLSELGWGDLELVDGGGSIHWRKWEGLEPVRAGRRASSMAPRQAPSSMEAGTAPTKRRWDQAADLGILGLSARSPLAGQPERDQPAVPDETGTEDGAP